MLYRHCRRGQTFSEHWSAKTVKKQGETFHPLFYEPIAHFQVGGAARQWDIARFRHNDSRGIEISFIDSIRNPIALCWVFSRKRGDRSDNTKAKAEGL